MADQNDNDVRQQLLDLLLDRVAEERFPSSTMLDIIEQLIAPEDVEAYGAVLMSKIEDDTYPSMSLIRRVLALS